MIFLFRDQSLIRLFWFSQESMTVNNISSFALQNFYQLQTRSIQYFNMMKLKIVVETFRSRSPTTTNDQHSGIVTFLHLRWLASFELKLIFFRNTFCHHRSPFAEHKSVIFYRGHHSNWRDKSLPMKTLFIIEMLRKNDKMLYCAINS